MFYEISFNVDYLRGGDMNVKLTTLANMALRRQSITGMLLDDRGADST